MRKTILSKVLKAKKPWILKTQLEKYKKKYARKKKKCYIRADCKDRKY